MPASTGLRGIRERHTTLLRGSALFTAFLVSFGAGFAYASWAMVCRAGRCPPSALLDSYQPRQTSKLYAADGRFIAELGLERRTLVKLGDVPKTVQDAFVSVEDKRFYSHGGVDWQRVPGAVITDLRTGGWSQGFSTISMQLARNIFPERISREKSLVRKLKEIKVARDIERAYSKDRILELYVNQIYFGNGAHGVETAAQRYFGKSVRELNLAEAATLAAIPKSPTRYNPRKNPGATVDRRNTILELMRQEGKVSDADANLARSYPLKLAPKTETGEVAPYFVEHVRQLLDEKFGANLYEQGLAVHTTLDIDMQAAAERSMERQLAAIEHGKFGAYRHTSYERYVNTASGREESTPNSPYLQGAFIAIDPRTGGIRALIGGRDFDDNKFNRAVQALSQPGSTFKPIVYSAAVQNGRPLSYILDDAQLEVPMGDGSTWKPQNYDGGSAGKLSLRRALTHSRNIATVRLGMELGEQSVIDMARKFGISTTIPPYPSIHIGAASMYPMELIAAYTAFANLGLRAEPLAITRVESADGEVLWEPRPELRPVMSQEESWLMVSAMKDVVTRGTAGTSVGSQIRFPAAGKTGTTNDGYDVWFVGYTSDLVAGVWMGFDRPKRIKANAQGGVLAAPVWTSFMNEVYRRRRAPGDWPMPLNIVSREIDVGTNMLAAAYCPANQVGTEFFIPGTDPIYTCDAHTGYLYPDTGAYAYPPGTVDSLGRVMPPAGGTVIINPPWYDSLRRADSIRDAQRRRDSSMQRLVFPRRDTAGKVLPDTTVRRPDTVGRGGMAIPPGPSRPRPDTTRPLPDTTRPRPDTTRPRPDTTRPRPDTTRPRPDTIIRRPPDTTAFARAP